MDNRELKLECYKLALQELNRNSLVGVQSGAQLNTPKKIDDIEVIDKAQLIYDWIIS